MTLPTAIRDEVKTLLWAEADRLFWASLPLADKSRYYTIWTENPAIGGKLTNYMDPRQVRVYIKDTLLKAYTRERLSNPAPVLGLLGLPGNSAFKETYIQASRTTPARWPGEIAWSRATEWKATLMALHESAPSNMAASLSERSCSKHDQDITPILQLGRSWKTLERNWVSNGSSGSIDRAPISGAFEWAVGF